MFTCPLLTVPCEELTGTGISSKMIPICHPGYSTLRWLTAPTFSYLISSQSIKNNWTLGEVYTNKAGNSFRARLERNSLFAVFDFGYSSFQNLQKARFTQPLGAKVSSLTTGEGKACQPDSGVWGESPLKGYVPALGSGPWPSRLRKLNGSKNASTGSGGEILWLCPLQQNETFE